MISKQQCTFIVPLGNRPRLRRNLRGRHCAQEQVQVENLFIRHKIRVFSTTPGHWNIYSERLPQSRNDLRQCNAFIQNSLISEDPLELADPSYHPAAAQRGALLLCCCDSKTLRSPLTAQIQLPPT